MAYLDSTTGSGTGNIQSVAVPNAGGATPLQADDIVILASTNDESISTYDPGDWPTGFTELTEVQLTGDGQRSAVAWKRLTGADSGTYTLGAVGAGSPDWVLQAFAFRGRHTTNPPVISADATNNAANASPVTVTANGVTALLGDDILMISAPDTHASGVGTGHTQPTSYTEREDTLNGWCNLAGFTNENVSAGATGSVAATFTTSSSTAGWAAWTVRIPAAAGGAVTVKPFSLLGVG